MARKEVQVLAEMMDKTRQLTRFYISKLKEIDPYAKVQSGDKQFNSLYWLTAHMLWAADNLIVVATGGRSLAPEWISHYRIGADGSLHEGHGDYKALLDEMKAHHERAMAYLTAMNDEDLDQDNLFGFSFGDGDKSKRLVIMHAIRHEGTHIGNLAWMAKMSAVKTV